MTAPRNLLCPVFAAMALGLPLAAQSQGLGSNVALAPVSLQSGSTGRGHLGLTLSRSTSGLPCNATTLFCDSTERVTRVQAGTMIGNFWGVELGYADKGRTAGLAESRAPGLNFSLVGKAPLWQSLGVFGKLGTTYGRPDASIPGVNAGGEQAFGLSYGAGVSFAFTPRLSATLEWDRNDLRFAGSGREPVRSTSLGLQYRY